MNHVKTYEGLFSGWGKKNKSETKPESKPEEKKPKNPKKGDELAQIIIDRIEKSYSEKYPIKIKDEGFRTYKVNIKDDYYDFQCDMREEDFKIIVHGKKIDISEKLYRTIKKMYLEQEDREQDIALNKALDKLADYRKDAKKYNL